MEIELKFLIEATDVDAFCGIMSDLPFQVEPKATRQLTNAYYDTQDNALRQWDMGLRSRTSLFDSGDGWSEQTIKLAGQDIGGLHQRPEHTIKFDHAQGVFADLTKFDPKIWPEGFVAEAIQIKLDKVFETHFKRQIWLVTLPDGTVVECVLDQGEVIAGDRCQPICEIELEIVSGQVDEIFALAQYLCSKIGLKLGSLSKAARGYMLASETDLTPTNLEALEFYSDKTIEASFIESLTSAIKFIQHNELVFAATDSTKPLRRVLDGISFLIHILRLYSGLLPGSQCEHFLAQFKMFRRNNEWVNLSYQLEQLTARQSSYRKDIENSEYLHGLLEEHQLSQEKIAVARKQFYSTEFNQLMLNFLKWLSQKQWRGEMDLQELTTLSLPMSNVSGQWLENAWQKLTVPLTQFEQEPGINGIEKIYWPLATELLTGLCVGNLYPEEDRLSFRNCLLDLLLGLDEMMLLKALNSLLDERDDEEVERYRAWVNSKQQSLLSALTVSIAHTVKLKSYW
jgi:triphosphatase